MADQDKSKSPRINIDDSSRPSYPLEKMRGRQSQRRRAQAEAVHKTAGRIPPQAKDVEMSVLGAMLIEREAIPKAIEVLPPEAFYSGQHQKIYMAMLGLFERGNPVDLVTLSEELKRRGELDNIGGPYYLTELTTQVASAANVEYHARIIAEKSLLRKMIEKMTVLVGEAYEPGADAFELLDKAESQIFKISDNQLRKAASPLNDVVKETLEQLESIHGRKGGITGVPSGFTRLDDLTSGWQNSDLIIIAARPSMGKCLGKGTPVMMYDGTVKPVEDIRVGDQVMGDDSTPRTVLSLARGRERMYWVRQNSGMDYRVNENHILSLKKSRRGGQRPRGTVTDLSVREYLSKSAEWQNDNKGYKVEVEFPERPLPLDPYLLGLWLGDGKSDSARIYTTDDEVVEYLHATADAQGDAISVYDAHRPCPAYLIKSAERGTATHGPSIQRTLRELGVLGDKHIPHVYLANTRSRRLRLLAGLIDSDGHLNAGHGGTYEITQSDERLARQIKYLCDTLGYRTSLRPKAAQIASTGYRSTVYRVRFNGNVDEIPVRVARKKATPWTDFRDWRVTGLTVEPDGVGDYYGFTLDGNHRFLLADGTVTHNTAFSLACALNAATHPRLPTGVAIFSLEMGAQQLAQRLLTSEARVDAQRARTGRMRDDDWQRLARAAGKLSEADVFIDDTPGLSVLELRAKCRRLKAEHDIGLVVVDYLQLMQGSAASRNSNREQEIAHISRSLKGLAKELDIPVIALSQLNRSVESRGGDKRPQLSDLRESGCLTGDTLVTMADTGARVPMRELCGTSGFKVWALNPDTYKLEPRTVSNAFCTGTKPVYRLQTQLGRTIRATGNHKFLTIDGWKRLDELAEGEHIALPRKIASPQEATMTDSELALLGHLIGDGCTLAGHAIQYTTRERDLAERVATLASEVFGDEVDPRMQAERTWYQAYLTSTRAQTHGARSAVSEWLDGMNVWDLRSHEKRVPEYKSNMSRDRAVRVANVVDCDQLRRLAESDVYWDRLASIEMDGTEKVYDLTVPGHQNFLANGIIVHNSIEQDADVVAFIYRAERYGITVDENGNSTEGIAEIIIGKQRNGPIGNVELAFVNQYALFENLSAHYDSGGYDDGYSSGGGYDDGGYDDYDDGGGDGFSAPQPPPLEDDAPF